MPTDLEKILRLQTWLSPSFPVGGYSFSHALEAAIEADLVRCADSLLNWLEADLTVGAGRVDALLLCASWRAVSARDAEALIDVAALAAALRGTAEFSLEAEAQGAAFLSTVTKVWCSETLLWASDCLKSAEITLVLPVAVGMACAAEELPLELSTSFFLHALVANLVSAAVRAVPLGQTDGQRVIASLEADIVHIASEALACDLDDIGSATLMIDVLSMHHETQYTRIFRS
ncbi:MAG: urease accessory protein UreF [Alphaproteobacteria bacterium]